MTGRRQQNDDAAKVIHEQCPSKAGESSSRLSLTGVVNDRPRMYNRVRLAVIVCFLIINSSGAVASTMGHHYPIGVAAVLFLIPALLRELDLKNGRPARSLGSFGWSCLIAGMFFLIALPVIVL